MFDFSFDNVDRTNNKNGLLVSREKENLDEEDEESDQSSYDINPLDNYVTT